MGYYICPRCASNQTYMGNVLVNPNIFERFFGEKSSRVLKCKGCGEILTNSNYCMDADEIDESNAQNEKNSVLREKQSKTMLKFWLFFGILVFAWLVKNLVK